MHARSVAGAGTEQSLEIFNCDACVRANGGAGNAKRKRIVKES